MGRRTGAAPVAAPGAGEGEAVGGGRGLAIEVAGLDVSYGVIRAASEVSLAVGVGRLSALIGSNGAGKSSVLKAIAGVVPAKAGRVLINGVDVTGLPTKQRLIDHGLVLVPEGRSVFTTMTIAENLELGERVGRQRARHGGAPSFTRDQAFELFPVLGQRAGSRAQVLSGGEQQMLAIARSLLMAPLALLIDEPSMGLAPLLVRQIFAVLDSVFAESQVSVLLVEQDTALALEVADDAYLLEHGRIVTHAPSSEMRHDPRLRESYLGSHDALGRAVPPTRTAAAVTDEGPEP